MANIRLTLPAEPFSGQIVTFTAPCDCSAVSNGLFINNDVYTVCNALGECVTGKGGVWAKGAQVSVVLDCENQKAYIQNGNATPSLIGAASANHTHTPEQIGAASADKQKVAHYRGYDLSSIGVDVSTMSATDVTANLKMIYDALNAKETDSELWLTLGNSNFRASLLEKLKTDCGITWTSDLVVTIVKRSYLMEIHIIQQTTTNTAYKNKYTCIYRHSSTAPTVTAFSVTVDPNGFVSKPEFAEAINGVAKVVTGSYTGTGTYGKDNPNSLTFDGVVKFLWVFAENSTGNHHAPYNRAEYTKHAVSDNELTTAWVAGVGLGGNTQSGGDNAYGKKSADGKTIHWYSGSEASWQFNQTGSTYYYLAIIE